MLKIVGDPDDLSRASAELRTLFDESLARSAAELEAGPRRVRTRRDRRR